MILRSICHKRNTASMMYDSREQAKQLNQFLFMHKCHVRTSTQINTFCRVY